MEDIPITSARPRAQTESPLFESGRNSDKRISYWVDPRWKGDDFLIEGILFSNEYKQANSDITYGKSRMRWKSLSGKPDPADFLLSCYKTAVAVDANAEGLTGYIMFNLAECLEGLLQEHIFRSLIKKEEDTRLLHIIDYLLILQGREEVPTKRRCRPLPKGNMSFMVYHREDVCHTYC